MGKLKSVTESRCKRRPIEPLEARALLSASLWADTDATPLTPPTSMSALTVVGSQAFFTADDGIHGAELWRTDGTTAGTRMVADINPGSAGSVPTGPQMMRAHSGKLFFVANDGTHGEELWVSDGTSGGTHLVSDLSPNGGSSGVSNLTSFGTYVYFIGKSSGGFNLYRADANSTALVYFFNNFSLSPSNDPFVVSGNSMYLNPRDSSVGQELWVTDGTTAGTRLVKDFNPGTASGVSAIFNVNGVIYVSATTPATGYELWKTDGTTAGTTLVSDLVAGTASSSPMGVMSFGGKTYFFATDAAGAVGIWTTDGTTSGTKLAVDLKNGLGLILPSALNNSGSSITFIARGASTPEYRMFRTDGTLAGTRVVTGNDGALLSLGITVPPAVVGDSTLFLASSPNVAQNVYRLPNGTDQAKRIPAGDYTANRFLVPFQGGALAVGNDSITGESLWFTDATTNTARMVADVYPGTRTSGFRGMARVGNRIWFVEKHLAPNGNFVSADLWATDVDGQRPHLVSGALPALMSVSDLVPFGADGVAFLGATSAGRDLYVSDGTAAGTRAMKVPLGIGDASDTDLGSIFVKPGAILSTGDRIYFVGTDAAHGRELWSSDGTPAGTGLFVDTVPGSQSSTVGLAGVMGGVLYFTAGPEPIASLYRSDGTPASVVAITNEEDMIVVTPARPLPIVNGLLYFTALDSNTAKTWVYNTNGTAAGTNVVKTTSGTLSYDNAASLVAASDSVYFTATRPSRGVDIWQLSGSRAFALVDAAPAAQGTAPIILGTVGNRVFFTAADATSTRRLISSDGTSAGTAMISSLPPATTTFLGSTIDHAYFAANDPATGTELWQSDGTPGGTSITADVLPGTGSAVLTNEFAPRFAAYDDRFIVTLYDNLHGVEPWITADERAPLATRIAYDNARRPVVSVRFNESMEAAFDPAKARLVNRVTGATFGVSAGAFDAAGRTLSLNVPLNLPDGDYTLNLDASAVRDHAGHTLGVGSSVNFAWLPGDADGDRDVDFADLVLLAQNYGKPGRTFAQGNFDYSVDGLVSFGDLVLLAQRYNTKLVVPPASAAVLATATTVRSKTARPEIARDVVG